jgi:hypothetical protein
MYGAGLGPTLFVQIEKDSAKEQSRILMPLSKSLIDVLAIFSIFHACKFNFELFGSKQERIMGCHFVHHLCHTIH